MKLLAIIFWAVALTAIPAFAYPTTPAPTPLPYTPGEIASIKAAKSITHAQWQTFLTYAGHENACTPLFLQENTGVPRSEQAEMEWNCLQALREMRAPHDALYPIYVMLRGTCQDMNSWHDDPISICEGLLY